MPSAISHATPRVAVLQKSDGPLTWRTDLTRGFRECGAAVINLDFRPAGFSEHRIHRTSKKARLLFNPATCRRLAAKLAAFSPDLVITLNYSGLTEMSATAIRGALRTGVPVIGWTCDHLDTLSPGHLPLFDGVYYFDSASGPVLAAAYRDTGARLAFLPLAACPQRFACPSTLTMAGRRRGVGFAGNCTPSRHRFFEECRRLGLPLDLFGPRAGNFPAIWRNRKLGSAAVGRIYRTYVANLNLLQPPNTEHGLNLRAFEIPCAGGLGTYPAAAADLARSFIPGKEIVAYQDAADLVRIMERLLADPGEALAMTQAGHARVMAEHTFRHRAATILADWLGYSSP